jgi:hypothetical protein
LTDGDPVGLGDGPGAWATAAIVGDPLGAPLGMDVPIPVGIGAGLGGGIWKPNGVAAEAISLRGGAPTASATAKAVTPRPATAVGILMLEVFTRG